MIFWLILKTLPSLSNYLELDDIRQMLYIGVGFFLVLEILLKKNFYSIIVKQKEYFFLLALFSIVLLLNITNYGKATKYAETMILARSLFLSITLFVFITNKKSALILLCSLVFYIVIVQALSILEFLNIISQKKILIDEKNAGILKSTFTLSYSSVVSLGIALILLNNFHSLFTKNFLYFMVIISIINLFYSVSRTTLFGILCISIYWFLEKIYCKKHYSALKQIRLIRNFSIVFLFIIGATIIYYGDFLDDLGYGNETYSYYISHGLDLWRMRLEVLINSGMDGQSVRWNTNNAGIEIFIKNILTGVGWDNAANYLQDYGGIDISTAHNVFIQSAAEGGIFGIAFSIILFFIIPYRLFKKFKYIPGSCIFAGVWITIVFFNMVASNLHLESHWDLLFFWITLTAYITQKAKF